MTNATGVMDKTYLVRYYCTNCQYSFTRSIDKGQIAPEEKRCPVCECNTGERSWGLNKYD